MTANIKKQQEFNFLKAKAMSFEEYEMKHRIIKGGILASLPQFQDAIKAVEIVKEQGVAPFEVLEVFDLEDVKKENPKAAKMTTLIYNFMTQLRKVIKSHNLEKCIRVQQRGDRVFLISNES